MLHHSAVDGTHNIIYVVFVSNFSKTLHDEWFIELKKNDFMDKETSMRIPQETIKLLEIQRDITIKQLIGIPELYETKNNTLIEVSNRAY